MAKCDRKGDYTGTVFDWEGPVLSKAGNHMFKIVLKDDEEDKYAYHNLMAHTPAHVEKLLAKLNKVFGLDISKGKQSLRGWSPVGLPVSWWMKEEEYNGQPDYKVGDIVPVREKAEVDEDWFGDPIPAAASSSRDTKDDLPF